MHLEIILRADDNDFYFSEFTLMMHTRMLFSTATMEKIFKNYYPETYKMFKENIASWDADLEDKKIKNKYESNHEQPTKST